MEGIDIIPSDLIGKWFYNGRIKDGKQSDLILKHNKNEVVNYTFKENSEFINRAPFGIELKGTWSIDKDKEMLMIQSNEKSEYVKVVKLKNNELHLYNPKNESILKFIRK